MKIAPALRRLLLATAAVAATSMPAIAATYTLTTIAVPGAAAPSVNGIAQNGLYYGSYRTKSDGNLHLFTVSSTGIARRNMGVVSFISFTANSAGSFAGGEGIGIFGYDFTIPAGGGLHRRFDEYPPAAIAYDDAGDRLGRTFGAMSGKFFGVLTLAGQHRRELRAPGYDNTVVVGMNNAAEVIGYADGGHPFSFAGFIYANGVFTPVLGPDGGPAEPVGINDGGSLVIQGNDGGPTTSSFLLVGGLYTKLAYPGALGTYAHGINTSNAVYGTYTDAAHVTHGFAYKAGLYTSFDPLPGASFSGGFLNGMDNAGNIVGAENRGGRQEPFYAACTGTGC